MAKVKKKYVCQQCGSVSFRWQGQCEECGEWNSLVEEAGETVFSARHSLQSGGRAVALQGLASDIALPSREKTGIAEFDRALGGGLVRSEEHTSELQSLMRISYAVFCLKKKKHN